MDFHHFASLLCATVLFLQLVPGWSSISPTFVTNDLPFISSHESKINSQLQNKPLTSNANGIEGSEFLTPPFESPCKTKCDRNTGNNTHNRRSALIHCATSASIFTLLPAVAESIPISETAPKGNDESEANFECLRDLPPVTKDCVRVYLCRHGQTENNRLHLVQGARVDPPLNDTGTQQASRIGKAISHLDPLLLPKTVKHSKLQRARETAQLAVKSYSLEQSAKEDLFNKKKDDVNGEPLRIEMIPSLGEVDFGPVVEGKQSSEVRAKMTKVYGAWSIGLIDEKGEGGESARDIFLRMKDALEKLSDTAQSDMNNGNNSPILAVSHSMYIRMLLGTALDISLPEAALLTQKNGCINVIDINVKGKKKKILQNSNLFGGPMSLSKGAKPFSIEFPLVHVIRMNEIQHLSGLI